MADLAQYVQKQSQTVAAIYAAYKRKGDAESARNYLGASAIGHPCERYLWYSFRHACRPEFDGRMYRLFETGDLAEARFCKDLRAIGCTVHETDETGRQFAVSALGGHFSGHLDGCVQGVPEAPKTWHVQELKTHNAKSFAKLQKEGVAAAKPQHYAQMQVYMHLTGMTRALYLAVNKDTDELYSERVRYDAECAKSLMARAERIITSMSPPERISSRPDYYECNWCDARSICWGTDTDKPALPLPCVSCRQCCHATPTMDGGARWTCERHKRGLSADDQARACEDHLALPGLLSFAEPVDASADHITFQVREGWQFQHGKAPGQYSTRELTILPAVQLCNLTIQACKRDFEAAVTGYTDQCVLSRYPDSDSRRAWKGPVKKLAEVWKTRYGEDLLSLVPLAKCECSDHRAAEFPGGRVAVAWTWVRQKGSTEESTILEGVE